VARLKEQLLESLKLRVMNIPSPPGADIDGTARLAVLFSGGLDCTVLARLAHEVLDADQGIDLLNVAFENPRVVSQLRKEHGNLLDCYEACPDRITGRRSFAELQRLCPGRAFRFVAVSVPSFVSWLTALMLTCQVNIPYAETQAHRQQVISLIHPHNTEMDLSIGYALYFAARGQGLCTEASGRDSPPVSYTSPARVLLSGLGADELFGGYSRHPSAFQQRGYAGLIDELLLDVGRLGKRNLGRDDRVMAHWGKEVRFPFLDERLVRWAIETPAWEKCDFDNGEEAAGLEPGKRVLRLLALDLGMQTVAKEKKRAVSILLAASHVARTDNPVDPIRLQDSQDGNWACQRHHTHIIASRDVRTPGGDDTIQILLSHGRDSERSGWSAYCGFYSKPLRPAARSRRLK
jgi:asparagine synthetase B (glutamine-hydrolysing)